jgi:hypothetical protein
MSFFSYTCQVIKIILFRNNGLKKCLIFVQRREMAGKQGKITVGQNLSAQLSTETVDLFSLDLGRSRLQPRTENHISGL